MIDEEVRIWLCVLERDLNDYIDKLIVKRQLCQDDDKYKYRYINNKLQVALTAINRALDKVEGK